MKLVGYYVIVFLLMFGSIVLAEMAREKDKNITSMLFCGVLFLTVLFLV